MENNTGKKIRNTGKAQGILSGLECGRPVEVRDPTVLRMTTLENNDWIYICS